MKIEKDRVVRFHYAVAERAVEGQGAESVENSRDNGQPLAILFGHGNIIPGLEKAMDGHQAGDSFKASVPAAEAYGERR
ncbi:MAG: FKBP-type peptidyl-prolyl cis-trans isomerase, partial [Pseudoxanthomonas sp.]